MTETKFLEQLNDMLKPLELTERQEILEDFKEHFAMGREEGKLEADIASSLGSPQKISKELLASYHIEKVETTRSPSNVLRAVWAAISLGFFNLVIVLGPFIALVGILVAGWVVGISFTGSPLLVLANTVVYPSIFESYDLFLSMILAGIGLFIIVGMFHASKKSMSLFIRYMKYNVRIVKGETKHV